MDMPEGWVRVKYVKTIENGKQITEFSKRDFDTMLDHLKAMAEALEIACNLLDLKRTSLEDEVEIKSVLNRFKRWK